MKEDRAKHEQTQSQWHLAIAVVVFSLAAIYCLNTTGRVYVHFVVSQFCHGVSAGKILFFLGYVGLLQLVYAIRLPSSGGKKVSYAFIGAIAIGFLANLASYGIYLNAFSLNANDITLHWREGINSINSLSHIHTGKVAIAWILEMFSWGSLHTVFDTGAVYLDVIPTYVAGTLGICFLIALVSSFLLAPIVINQYPVKEQLIIGFILSWVLVSLCKCLLDGGLLAYDAMASLILLKPILVSSTINELFIKLKKQLPFCCVVLATWMLFLNILQPGSLEPQVERLIVRSALYLSPLLLLWLCDTTPVTKRSSLLLSTLVFCLALLGIKRSAEKELFPLFDTVPSQLTYVSSYGEQSNLLLPIKKQHLTIDPSDTFLETYLTLGVSPYRCSSVSFANSEKDLIDNLVGRILLPSCDLTGLKFSEDDSVQLVALEPMTAIAEQDSKIKWVDCYFSAKFDEPLGIGRLSESMDQVQENERYFAYKLLDHHLRRSGLSQYILIPYGFLPKKETTETKECVTEQLEAF